MNKRVTLITLLEQKTLDYINNMVEKTNIQSCKVPYGVCEDRLNADTLPYHFTISAWDKNEQEKIIDILKEMPMSEINLKIIDIDLMNGKENSYVLYFSLENDSQLREIQRKIYKELPSEKYNPDTFTFHITIDIDKDYEKVLLLRDKLKENFEPFNIVISKLGLFEIYPAVNVFKTI